MVEEAAANAGHQAIERDADGHNVRPRQRDEREVFGAEHQSGQNGGRARAQQGPAGQRRAFGKAAGARGVEDGDGCGGIDGRGREGRAGIGDAEEAVESIGLVVGLNPGADGKRVAVENIATEDGLVGDQDVGAAVGQDAADLGEREHGVERDGDAAGADDGEEPMEVLGVVGAIDGDGLAGLEVDRAAKKRVEAADLGVQFGQTKRPALLDGNFAISVSAEQLVDQVGHGDVAIAGETIGPEKTHWTGTGLRPHSLATQ